MARKPMQYFITPRVYIVNLLVPWHNAVCTPQSLLLSACHIIPAAVIKKLNFEKTELKLYVYAATTKLFGLFRLSNLFDNHLVSANRKWLHARYFFLGLGYKVYTRRNVLFIWVGLTHYTLIEFPKSVFIFAKKRRMYLLSAHEKAFKTLVASVQRTKKKDIYKGKGLLQVKSYKNFVRMKTGKKKQY